MYTVIRFIDKLNRPEVLGAIGFAVNQCVQNAFKGQMDRGVPNRFSLSISTSKIWHEHRLAMLRFLEECQIPINKANESGLAVQFDVAVKPGDYSARPFTCYVLDDEIIDKLAASRVFIEFSIYAGK